MLDDLLTIGKLAKHSSTTAVTIRYYERQGLIKACKRSKGGYRLYEADAVTRLHFIKNAKEADFSLEEIKELLSLQQKKVSSKAVKQMTLKKIEAIRNKITILKNMEKTLSALANRCDGKSPINQCPILEKFSKER